jgi:hypothetical protein
LANSLQPAVSVQCFLEMLPSVVIRDIWTSLCAKDMINVEQTSKALKETSSIDYYTSERRPKHPATTTLIQVSNIDVAEFVRTFRLNDYPCLQGLDIRVIIEVDDIDKEDARIYLPLLREAFGPVPNGASTSISVRTNHTVSKLNAVLANSPRLHHLATMNHVGNKNRGQYEMRSSDNFWFPLTVMVRMNAYQVGPYKFILRHDIRVMWQLLEGHPLLQGRQYEDLFVQYDYDFVRSMEKACRRILYQKQIERAGGVNVVIDEEYDEEELRRMWFDACRTDGGEDFDTFLQHEYETDEWEREMAMNQYSDED